MRIETRNPELRQLERKLDTIGVKVPLALLVCSLFVSSAVLLSFDETGGFKTVMGIIGAAVSSLLAIRLFLR